MALFKRKKKIEKQEVLEEKKSEVKIEEKPKVEKKIKTKKEKNKKKQDRLENILIRPLITEKVSIMGSLNQYVFEVEARANKVEVKKAMNQVYGVKPTRVNIVNVLGKNVRFGRSQSRRKSWRKAIVTLKQGDKIEVYEGV